MKKKRKHFNLLDSKTFLLAFFPAFFVVAIAMMLLGFNALKTFSSEAALTPTRLTTIAIMPSADGYYKEWSLFNSATTTPPSNHYTLVDESTCNSTDYVFSTSTVPENTDSYVINLGGVPNGSVIKKISVQPCASINSISVGSPTSTLSVFYKLNGIDSTAKTYALNNSAFKTLTASTWSGLSVPKNASSTLEIGILHLDGAAGLKISNLKALITY